MPARKDIKKILVVGSDAAAMGRSAEYDHAGVQACVALRALGYKTAMVSSNPTALMTDPMYADTVYIEPLVAETVAMVIGREQPDAVFPVAGGMQALDIVETLSAGGVLKKHGTELIGLSRKAVAAVRDRRAYLKAATAAGLAAPEGRTVNSLEAAEEAAALFGFPVSLRPVAASGGSGCAILYNAEDFEQQVTAALGAGPTGVVLVEELLYGWKEIECVLVRDAADNVAVVGVFENIDPVGVHSGDSMTVVPSQTLSHTDVGRVRRGAEGIARGLEVVGVAALRFARNPRSGEMKLIHMSPCYNRSCALVSRSVGYPLARVAASVAVGLSLDEITDVFNGGATAFQSPAPDYCVTKLCRFAFEKFLGADDTLDSSMKSVGEAIGVGRTFRESVKKAIRALEIRSPELGAGEPVRGVGDGVPGDADVLKGCLTRPAPGRLFHVFGALEAGMSSEEVSAATLIDRWFIDQLRGITELESELKKYRLETVPGALLRRAKESGIGDHRIARLLETEDMEVRKQRKRQGITPGSYEMDASGGGKARYSTYEGSDAVTAKGNKKKVIILGGGPNRIGQGIEFDYCCVHASYAIKEAGFVSILVNSNPETVSTDFDTSDKLYFEPLTFEDVMNIIDVEKPMGVIVQLGGQTPLNLANSLMKAGVPILGTSPDSIDRAEDRERFKVLLDKLNLTQPDNDTATNVEEAVRRARQIGYPLLVRPSYVLGGRAMQIVYEEDDLREYMARAVEASPDRPVLLDRFLDDAIEVDVDAVADGEMCVVCGVMEHIEQAGVHSGDSACCLPPYTLNQEVVDEIKGATKALARELNVVGLMNVQFAVKNDVIYVLEVNPRASRTVPFVSKATGVPWAKVATRVMLGFSLKKQGVTKEVVPEYMSVKEAVFPFSRFPGVDATLGPEMLSTGEVMGLDRDFGMAFLKSQIAAGQKLPEKGAVFISVKNSDKRAIVPIAKKLVDMGFSIVATEGTASTLRRNGMDVKLVHKLGYGRPNVIDIVKNREVVMLINTPAGKATKVDEAKIRSTAIARDIPLVTTVSGAQATIQGMEAIRERGMSVAPLQDYHNEVLKSSARSAKAGSSSAGCKKKAAGAKRAPAKKSAKPAAARKKK